MSTSLETTTDRFLDWFRQHGGYLHPALHLKKDESGLSVYTNSALPESTRLISTPFELAITVETAKRALGVLYPAAAAGAGAGADGPASVAGGDGGGGKTDGDAGDNWSERMLVATYVALHWLYTTGTPPDTDQTKANDTGNGHKADSTIRELTQSVNDAGTGNVRVEDVLRHQEYIASLPSPETLTTPLFFSKEERDLLRGTNLHGVVLDREGELREEWGRVEGVVGGLGWEQYLTATTYISSRAFPSRLLSIPAEGANETSPMVNGETSTIEPTGTGGPNAGNDEESTDASYPVLIPGLDLFNHSRGQPITWLSSPIAPSPPPHTPSSKLQTQTPDPIPSISFISPTPIPANSQVFNNYGPKSNEELLLSYGFVIPHNPDDTLILRLAAPTTAAAEGKTEVETKRRFVIRRDGEVPRDLLELMRGLMGGGVGHIHGDGCHDHAHDHDHDKEGEDVDDDDEDGHAAHEKEMEEMQLEMDVLGELGGMLEDKLEKLRAGAGEVEAEASEGVGGETRGVREEVRRMVEIYRQGQIDIIEATQDKLSERIDRLEGLVDQGMGTCPCGC